MSNGNGKPKEVTAMSYEVALHKAAHDIIAALVLAQEAKEKMGQAAELLNGKFQTLAPLSEQGKQFKRILLEVHRSREHLTEAHQQISNEIFILHFDAQAEEFPGCAAAAKHLIPKPAVAGAPAI